MCVCVCVCVLILENMLVSLEGSVVNGVVRNLSIGSSL